MRRDVVLAAVVGAAVAGAVVGVVDALRPDAYIVTTKPVSASGGIFAEADGWSYNVPTDIAWRDADGVFHSSGRPDCLPPSGKEEGPIRFNAVPVDADGVKFRQVIYVECK